MKKALLTTAVAALIAGTALTGTAIAKGGYGGRGGHGGFGGHGGDAAIEHVIRALALDLDDAQRAQVRAIADEARPDSRTRADARQGVHDQFSALTKAETLDRAALQALADAQGDAIAEAMVARVEMMHAIRAVLTTEQLEKLDTMRERRGGHRGYRHGRKGGDDK